MPLEKVRKLFVSAHSGDETLFGAFTIQREQPRVLVVFDSSKPVGQDGTASIRRYQTGAALFELLGDENTAAAAAIFAGVRDDLNTPSLAEALRVIDSAIKRAVVGNFDISELEQVWYPSIEIPAGAGEAQRELVSMVVGSRFTGAQKTRYLTTVAGRKSSDGVPVSFTGEMLKRKFRALACYRSQLDDPRAIAQFLAGQVEYYEHSQALQLDEKTESIRGPGFYQW